MDCSERVVAGRKVFNNSNLRRFVKEKKLYLMHLEKFATCLTGINAINT